jgi:isocitrate dehydrogenase kinase/phosphatase
VAKVCDKYRVVHEINRAGSMLDNVMYFNLRLDRDMFDPKLLDELCREAAGSVQLDRDGVYLRTLIAQLKIVPLPVFLHTADEDATRAVMVSLGHCIRNNAATNIFNKDLDSRNYGVGRYGRVFLGDYDAVEKLTDVKIRTNADREPGEPAGSDELLLHRTVPRWRGRWAGGRQRLRCQDLPSVATAGAKTISTRCMSRIVRAPRAAID